MSSVSRRHLIAGMAGTAAGSTLLPAVLHASSPPNSEVPALPTQEAIDEFNVLFIRHAESVVNVAPEPGVLDDGVTYPLTELGVSQLSALVRQLSNVDVSAIYSSTRLRCLQTADGIALDHGLVVNLAPEIVEWMVGDPSAIDGAEVAQVFAAWSAGDLDAKLETSESLRDMLDRSLTFLQTTIAGAQDDPRTLIFVAHGGIWSGVLPYLLTNVEPAFALGHILTNTGVVSAKIVGGELVCTSWDGETPA